MRLQTANQTIGAANGGYFRAHCDASDAVGQAVYIFGDTLGGLYQVRRVDITNRSKFPARGIIIEKYNGGAKCVVQCAGRIIDLPGYTSLTPQRSLFVDLDAYLTQTYPFRPGTGLKAAQIVGHARAANEFFVDLKSPIILVAH